jgi:nitrogen fixation NifU-like protein
MSSYTDKVIDHFQNPRNVGEIPDADGVGRVGNPSCGDIMEIYIKVDENEVITQCTFKTFGCAAAIATSSMTTELVIGMTIEEAERMTKGDVAESLGGLPKIKMHCSNLATDALRAAIAHYRCKNAGTCKDLAKLDLSGACDADHHHDDEEQDEDLG